MAKKKSRNIKRKKKTPLIDTEIKTAVAILAVIILALLIVYGKDIFPKDDIVADVNGQKITLSELDIEYKKIPVEYQEVISKDVYLNQTLIPQIILIQEAEKLGIKATSQETENFINSFLEESGVTKEQIDEQLEIQGLTYDQFFQFYTDRLKVVKLLNETIGTPIIPEEESRGFYNDNKASFTVEGTAVSYEEVKDQIDSFLAGQKQQEMVNDYISEVRDNADIKIYYENIKDTDIVQEDEVRQIPAGATFDDTGDEVCYEDGKPVIRMFSTSVCPHCRWIGDTFNSIVQEYVDSGDIIAYRWELDTKDNLFTDEVETGLPKSIKLSSTEIREALAPVLHEIVGNIVDTLEETPPELVSDIMESGIVMAGGGSLLPGIDEIVSTATKMPVIIAEDPITCVVRGCGKVLEDRGLLNRIKVTRGL